MRREVPKDSAATLTRRSLLRGVGGLAALHLAGWPAAARAGSVGDPRLVLVILRGGLDGLAAVPAVGDPHWSSARAGLEGPGVGDTGGPTRLDALFALDARLGSFRDLYAREQLTVVHAVSLPYRERSHFDAQNLLESGGTRPFALPHGWLGRAIQTQPGHGAVGLQPVLPLVLRGSETATSWSPSSLTPPGRELLEGAEALYRRDPALAAGLRQGQAGRRIVSRGGKREAAAWGGASFPGLASAAAAFLSHADGPRVAVLELGGFDSHSLQALPNGGLDRALRELDAGIATLHATLGGVWGQTVVVVATEFGRTVAMNGSGGTDHGTAGAAFVLGGAVAGGRVVCDWPGLGPGQLHEGRDLRPTRDLRSVWMGVLRDHMAVSETALHGEVFPGSAAVAPLAGLVRG